METITVVIADDHPLVREGLRGELENLGTVKVVAEAANGPDAVDATVRHRPDVTFLDIRMPDGDGITATRAIQDMAPATRVILFTIESDPDQVEKAMRAGADGYLLKDATGPEISDALRDVMAGKRFLQPTLAALLMDEATTSGTRRGAGRDLLSPRQRNILSRVAAGASDREIAEALGLSIETVRTHLDRAFLRLGVPTRGQAVAEAARQGLLESP